MMENNIPNIRPCKYEPRKLLEAKLTLYCRSQISKKRYS